MVHVGAGLDRLARIGGDEIVGLEALLFDAGTLKAWTAVADQRRIAAEILRRLGALRLVLVVDARCGRCARTGRR